MKKMPVATRRLYGSTPGTFYFVSFAGMKKIALLSDTHSYLDAAILDALAGSDEIWHAGDFGSMEVIEKLQAGGLPLRGVWGNIDAPEIRSLFPETALFEIAGLKVLMQHIGGYPGRYAPGIKAIIQKEKPGLFISGHSHTLKIIFDDALQCLHMNPGAAGLQGWHKQRTLIRFAIDKGVLKDCEVVELGGKGMIVNRLPGA